MGGNDVSRKNRRCGALVLAAGEPRPSISPNAGTPQTAVSGGSDEFNDGQFGVRPFLTLLHFSAVSLLQPRRPLPAAPQD